MQNDWKKKLTPQQFKVLREKETEAPGTGELLHNKEKGMYNCAGCGQQLFSSDTKFDSGTGWPSFDKAIPGAVKEIEDLSHGMRRLEAVCSICGGHLGHLFDDGPSGSKMRYCINSCSLNFKKVN
ncbi:MAG: peptide-methionine (R)-S-oxide reductase MsrB [Nanoarchaeota archaeon]